MDKNYIDTVRYEVMRRLMACMLLIGGGVRCLEGYFDTLHIILGWMLVVTSIAYMGYLGYVTIVIRLRSRG